MTFLVDLLVAVWGLRLSWHILRRFLRSSEQDERYTVLINNWPPRYRNVQAFWRIFLLQAVLATLISLPVIVIHLYRPEATWTSFAGMLVWIIGFGLEAVADLQLRRFLQRPRRADLLQDGLWQYSRQPNYFGEITMWWGIALICSVTPLWWLGSFGAVVITYLICFVSGIPPAEARAVGKDGWTDYKRRTSVLVPWPPKRW